MNALFSCVFQTFSPQENRRTVKAMISGKLWLSPVVVSFSIRRGDILKYLIYQGTISYISSMFVCQTTYIQRQSGLHLCLLEPGKQENREKSPKFSPNKPVPDPSIIIFSLKDRVGIRLARHICPGFRQPWCSNPLRLKDSTSHSAFSLVYESKALYENSFQDLRKSKLKKLYITLYAYLLGFA